MDERDRQDIVNTLIAEAYGEGSEGMRRVAETILNRSDIRGITPGEVVRQPSQYTGYWSPGASAREAQRQQEARDAAWAAYELAQGPDDPTRGADHYFNPNIVQPSWARNMEPTGQYGGHAFYNSRSGRTRQSTTDPATAPIPQIIGPGAVAQRNQVTPQIPAWAATGMNQAPRASESFVGDSFSRLASTRGQTNAGDSLAMSPVPGGQMRSPEFDGMYNAQMGGMTRVNPIRSWGLNPQAGPSAFGSFQQGGQDRLAPTTGIDFAGFPVTQSAGLLAQRSGTGVGTRLDVNPNAVNPMMASQSLQAMRSRPIPLTRPNFGMGGPGFAPVNAEAMAQVQPPVAMQRFAPTPVPVQQAPVGAMLGMAANGGLMMQGHNGVMNSITQSSLPWGLATGQASNHSDYRSGGDNDKNPSIGGYFKGR